MQSFYQWHLNDFYASNVGQLAHLCKWVSNLPRRLELLNITQLISRNFLKKIYL